MSLVATLAAVLVGLVLFVSGVRKVRGPEFILAATIYSWSLVSARQSRLLALLLPRIEIAVGLGLLGSFLFEPAFKHGAMLAFSASSLGLLLVFIVVQISLIPRAERLECGCGLIAGETLGIQSLARACALGLASALALTEAIRSLG